MRHCQVHDESDYFKHVSHVNGKFLPNDVILVMMLEVEEESIARNKINFASEFEESSYVPPTRHKRGEWKMFERRN